MENISLILYTKDFFCSVLKSPTQMGSLSINNSVTNISRLGTFNGRKISFCIWLCKSAQHFFLIIWCNLWLRLVYSNDYYYLLSLFLCLFVAIAHFLPGLRTKLMKEATHLCLCCSHIKVLYWIPCFFPISVFSSKHTSAIALQYRFTVRRPASLSKEGQVSQIGPGVC